MSKTYPTELYPADADILTLNGQTDPETGLAFIAAGVSPASSPSLQVQFDRRLDRQNEVLAPANQGRVVETGTLLFGVFPLWYCLEGYYKEYDGATSQSVSDDATTYVWIDASNVLQTGSDWPADTSLFLPLAKIVTASGVMTITDCRPFFQCPIDLGSRGSVDLTSDVTDVLPVANGGTGAAALTGILHGNGTSPVTASDVDLETEVTNELPVANGGTGAATAADARTNLGAAASGANSDITSLSALSPPLSVSQGGTGAGSLTGVVKGNGTDALTASDVDLAADVTGTLPVANGGTGQTTAIVVPYSPAIVIPSTLAVGVAKVWFVAPIAFTLKNAIGRVDTAPTGQALIIDVRVGAGAGSENSIFNDQSEMINIAATEKEDTSATKDHAVSAGERVSFEIEQVGSGIAGSDLTIVLNGRTSLQT